MKNGPLLVATDRGVCAYACTTISARRGLVVAIVQMYSFVWIVTDLLSCAESGSVAIRINDNGRHA